MPRQPQRRKAKPGRGAEHVYPLPLRASQRQPSEVRGEPSASSLPPALGVHVCPLGCPFAGGISAEQKPAVTLSLLPKDLGGAEGNFGYK